MDLPTNYVIDVIHRNCKRIKRKTNGVYNFECPICNEGRSKGKRRRGFYFPKDNYFYCQNCQRSWSPTDWIINVEHISFKELIKEASEHDNTFNEIINRHTEIQVKKNQHSLPYDCINLSDPVQLQYYRDNIEVQDCLKYIRARRLNSAINRPKTFYVSLSDRIHKNRLCIPFYDMLGKIVFYQTRAIYNKDEDIAKYLSKKDSDKTLYGIHNISNTLNYIFIFEGPIDAMFCQNGVAACGLVLTEPQQEQLNKYRLFEKIWVLDNQLETKEVYEKYEELVDRNEKVFFWPEMFKDYKDINEVCMSIKKDYIPPKLFISHALSGIKAKTKLKEYTNILTKSSDTANQKQIH